MKKIVFLTIALLLLSCKEQQGGTTLKIKKKDIMVTACDIRDEGNLLLKSILDDPIIQKRLAKEFVIAPKNIYFNSELPLPSYNFNSSELDIPARDLRAVSLIDSLPADEDLELIIEPKTCMGTTFIFKNYLYNEKFIYRNFRYNDVVYKNNGIWQIKFLGRMSRE